MKLFRSILFTVLLATSALSASPVFQMLDDLNVHYHHDLKSKGNLLGLYNPNTDVVHLRKRHAYSDEGNMNHTILHELGHWARADERLGPPGGPREPDWVEEIVVDVCAAIVADEIDCERCCYCQMQNYIDEQLGNRRLSRRRREMIAREIKRTAEYLLDRPLTGNGADEVLAAVGLSSTNQNMASR